MPYSTIRKILGWKECKSVSTANHRAKIIKWLTVLQSHAVASGNNLGLRGTDRGETYCALCCQERSWTTFQNPIQIWRRDLCQMNQENWIWRPNPESNTPIGLLSISFTPIKQNHLHHITIHCILPHIT